MPEELEQSAETSTQEPSQSFGESQGEQAESDRPSVGTDTRPAKEPTNGQKPKEALSRYERTKRQRAEIARREAVLAQRESQFAQKERAAAEAAKPKRDYTLNDLKKYRTQWEQEGNFELVEKADREIAAMEAEAQAERQSRTLELPPMGTPEHQAQWESAERELAQTDPEFMRDGTRLDAKLREIMGSQDGNIYRQHPRGIVAAYHRAKMELLEGDYKSLQTENSKLKTELQRYTSLTSIGGGAPARIGSGNRVESINDFSKLSVADMRKHLRRGAQRDGVPWF